VTLIEIVAALGIIAVGIVGILALFPVAIEAGSRASDRTAAAVLGEYVVEQVRLRADLVKRSDATDDMLDALNWGDYTYNGKKFTFDADPDGDGQPSTLPNNVDAYGSGEQIMWQYSSPQNDLTDQEMYSRYEVTLDLVDVDIDGSKPFSNDELKQVIVTVRWPRAFSEQARKRQDTMRFVTFIRPAP
jgi:type II secretory pathway pseudopilin PulG